MQALKTSRDAVVSPNNEQFNLLRVTRQSFRMKTTTKSFIHRETHMPKLETLADAFHVELQDIYSAEQQLAKALPKMVKKANCEKLSQALTELLQQTKLHVEQVASAFEDTGKIAREKKCESMAGLLKEVEETMALDADPDVSDAILIGLAQKVEHYEIATYGTLCTWAEQLGYTNAKRLLDQNMDDEEKADKMLSKLSKNANAAAKA
jgi:ferritin-like metal-binding protein YciE